MTGAETRGASLTVGTATHRFEVRSGAVPGEKDLPLSDAEVEAKFIRYAAPHIGEARAAELARAPRPGPLDAELATVLGWPDAR